MLAFVEDALTETLKLSGSRRQTGITHKWNQFCALLVKRFHHNRRDYRSYLSQILLPCLFVAIAMAISIIRPSTSNLPALQLAPAIYDDVVSFYRYKLSNDTYSIYCLISLCKNSMLILMHCSLVWTIQHRTITDYWTHCFKKMVKAQHVWTVRVIGKYDRLYPDHIYFLSF